MAYSNHPDEKYLPWFLSGDRPNTWIKANQKSINNALNALNSEDCYYRDKHHLFIVGHFRLDNPYRSGSQIWNGQSAQIYQINIKTRKIRYMVPTYGKPPHLSENEKGEIKKYLNNANNENSSFSKNRIEQLFYILNIVN